MAQLQGTGNFVHILILTCWHPTLCQNVMVFHQNIVGNMKFRYSLIIIDHHIDQNTSNLHQKMRLKGEFSRSTLRQKLLSMLSIFLSSHYIGFCQIHPLTPLYVKMWCFFIKYLIETWSLGTVWSKLTLKLILKHHIKPIFKLYKVINYCLKNMLRRYGIQHNDTWHNDTQHNNKKCDSQ